MVNHPCVRIFGIPMDLGQQRRGVDMGPSALRYAGLRERLKHLGYEAHDIGNVTVPQAEEDEVAQNKDALEGKAHYLPEVVNVLKAAYGQISQHLKADEYGIFMGGDHSMSIASVSAVTRLYGDNVGVLWVDAHTDMNTPQTTPSGNIHGMVLAALLGYGPPALTDIGYQGTKLKPENVAMVGIRDVDVEERQTVARSGVKVYTMRHVDESGMRDVARGILERFAHLDYIHISLDLDSCDPSIAPGVGTPVLGGLTYREAHLLMEILSDSGKVRTMDVVEINPILDHSNATAEIALELIASLFGQRII
jgi:arginase